MNTTHTALTLALTAFISTAGVAGYAQAAGNPFAMQPLTHGNMLAAAEGKAMEGKCGGDKAKTMEGKCGGDNEKAATPAKAGKTKEGKCGAKKAKAKVMEGKCGGEKEKTGAKATEGKCGGSK